MISFRDATHDINLVELAAAMDPPVNVQSLRQARMDPKVRAYRNPPAGWEEPTLLMVREKILRLQLVEKALVERRISAVEESLAGLAERVGK
jgi:hypothetical protein